jgi:hypothetical protein
MSELSQEFRIKSICYGEVIKVENQLNKEDVPNPMPGLHQIK